MLNKKNVLYTALGVVLALSVTGNVILLNKMSTAKETFKSIQTQLDKNKKAFQDSQTEYKTLQTNIGKENVLLATFHNKH